MITVDGTVYRWRVRKRPSRPAPLSFAVQQADRHGAVLIATLPTSDVTEWVGPPAAHVVPSMVAEMVRRGRAEGWQPDQPGPTVTLHMSQEIWAQSPTPTATR
ncbi:hypothetical protein [Actinoplanes sp. DH11]|uniref:hypothetical protein n=1 Tax=Actinoplanes sp. DH11 TaxID=2857011 RepID=UPI001E5C7A8D|nr:hypothetical protein [Actinoplanes sp. DH11]